MSKDECTEYECPYNDGGDCTQSKKDKEEFGCPLYKDPEPQRYIHRPEPIDRKKEKKKERKKCQSYYN